MPRIIDLDQLEALSKLTVPGRMGQKAVATGGEMTLDTLPSWTGCCGLFTPAGDTALMTLVLEDEPFLDWLGWVPNNECDQFVKMLAYVGPSGTAAGAKSSAYKAACDVANTTEYGVCEILLPDKGRLARRTPVRDITENNRIMYKGYPIFSKDGSQITDEITWSQIMAGMVLRQDIKTAVMDANSSSANQFAGLKQLVNTGYKNVRDGRLCSAMDSYVLDWNSNTIDYHMKGSYDLIDFIMAYVRRVWQRARWSQRGGINYGDMIIMGNSSLLAAILDAYTCWSVCPGSAYQPVNLQNMEARAFRNSLNGGAFGFGRIFVDGIEIPLMAFDWDSWDMSGTAVVGDLWILTRAIGGTRVLYGQYLDMREPVNAFNGVTPTNHYKSTDDGKFLVYPENDAECYTHTAVFRPNIYLSAPWAQVRIMNISVTPVLDPLSPVPGDAQYPEAYLTEASCPEDYLEVGI